MAERYDLIIAGGTVMTPGGPARTDIAVADGRIAALGALDRAESAEVFHAPGLHVLPGAIDTQVHFREPGNTHKEDLDTGTRAALLGGVTSIFEMPNTAPPTVTADALADKLRRAAGRAWCDYAFFVGAAADNVDRLAQLERLPGCAGVKMFMGSSTGNLLVPDDETVAAVLGAGTRRMAVHAEDEDRLVARAGLREQGKPATHAVWRDTETALLATRRLLTLARGAGRRVHVLHVTTVDEMDLLAANRDLATVETTPQHLTFAAPACYERLGTYAQMNPPIRDARHRAGLWRAVTDGVVDVIGSDHAPHTREEKDRPYPDSPSGMPGVQTLLPILLDHVHRGHLSLERVVDLTAAGPQRIYGIAGKGRIARGYDADFAVVDVNARWTITDDWIASRCGWTPFHGSEVAGRVVAAVLRGRVVMREGEIGGAPTGRAVRFVETLGADQASGA